VLAVRFPVRVTGVTAGAGRRWVGCRPATRAGARYGRCPVGRGVAAGHRA